MYSDACPHADEPPLLGALSFEQEQGDFNKHDLVETKT
jgi:hypothetical protein